MSRRLFRRSGEVLSIGYDRITTGPTAYLPEFTDAAIDTYAEWAPRQPGPYGLVELIAVDGPLNRVPVGASPLGARSARFNHVICNGWRDPAGVYLKYLVRADRP